MNTHSVTPPLEPILIPDMPPTHEETPNPRANFKLAVSTIPGSHGKKKGRARKVIPQKYTLEDAFDYFTEAPGGTPNELEFNNERCVRAVAFLLHYCSEFGNQSVQGYAAHGLGHILEKCAVDIEFATGRRPAGGDDVD